MKKKEIRINIILALFGSAIRTLSNDEAPSTFMTMLMVAISHSKREELLKSLDDKEAMVNLLVNSYMGTIENKLIDMSEESVNKYLDNKSFTEKLIRIILEESYDFTEYNQSVYESLDENGQMIYNKISNSLKDDFYKVLDSINSKLKEVINKENKEVLYGIVPSTY